jgi:hypothetical protein
MALVEALSPATLAPFGEPFVILGVPTGTLNATDVKYNRCRSNTSLSPTAGLTTPGFDVALMALVNSADASATTPWPRRGSTTDTDQSYDDVAVAVSAKNGNILLVAERKFDGEGEGTVRALYDQSGNRLTTGAHPARRSPARSATRTTGRDLSRRLGRLLYLSNWTARTVRTGCWAIGSWVRSSTRPERAGPTGGAHRAGAVGRRGRPAARKGIRLDRRSVQRPAHHRLRRRQQRGGPVGCLISTSAPRRPTRSRPQAEIPTSPAPAGTARHQHPQLAAGQSAARLSSGSTPRAAGGPPGGLRVRAARTGRTPFAQSTGPRISWRTPRAAWAPPRISTT